MRVTINPGHVYELSAEFADNVSVADAEAFLQLFLKHAVPNAFGHLVLAVGKMYNNSGWTKRMRAANRVLKMSHTEIVGIASETTELAEITKSNITMTTLHANAGDIIRNVF